MKRLAHKIDVFGNETEALLAINELPSKINIISFLNAHAYTLANKNDEFLNSLLNSELLLRDGIGAKWLMQSYGLKHGYNANGTDLIPLILESSKDKKICFIGTQSPYLEDAIERCRDLDIPIQGFIDGFQDFETMLTFVKEHKPELLILGMGMPKQEVFCSYLKENYDLPITVVNGGAIFDFLAGRFKRAPVFFRKLGIEWFYRLINEPKRLFHRYVIGIPKFSLILLRHKIKRS